MRRHDAAAGHRIEVRRPDVLHHAVNTEIGVAVIVGVEKDDVRLRREERRAKGEEKSQVAHDAA